MKDWITKATEYLNHSLGKIPQELNELDWKESLSPKKAKLCQHICAFANHPGGGFLAFGIDDKTGLVNGISREQVDLIVTQLANLCREGVEPFASIDHSVIDFREESVLLVYIKESAVKPVKIRGKSIEDSYIRSGGSTRPASRHEIGGLMLNSKTPVFEELHASKLKNSLEILSLLDFVGILRLLDKPVPSNTDEIMSWLTQEKMITPVDSSGYYISNLGALAASYRLNDFDDLSRKNIRLIKYEGRNKTGKSKEFPMTKGYAIGFEELIQFIQVLLSDSEVIERALRRKTAVYPEIALRELIANALVHQDFSIRGSGAMIEIFDDRIEISNPGKLLPGKKIDRLIRTTPQSRNELLAKAFRRYNICEERGSGFEKAVVAIEFYGLPPLRFEETENSFKVTLFSPKSFAEMSLQERIDACYQHTIIQYYEHGGMTNSSLRQRFGMNDKQSSQVSRLIREAIESGKIKPKDTESDSKKFTIYLPYWA